MWRFIHVNDIQVGSPRSFRFAPAWNENWQTARRQIIALEPDFLLIGGDLTRDGWLHDFELEEIRADLDALPFPVHTIPGNMDVGNKFTRVNGAHPGRDDIAANLSSERLKKFAEVFGRYPWSFVHEGVRFSGFYEAVAGSGLPEETVMWRWLEELGELEKSRHHVMMTHYPLFFEDPDEDTYDIQDPESYQGWYFSVDQPHKRRMLDLFSDAGVDLVLSGHMHIRLPVKEVQGMRFFRTAATCFPQMKKRWPEGDPTLGFLEFTVTDEGLHDRFIPLEEVSRAKGYGPGGHPGPEQRDYSIAWEK